MSRETPSRGEVWYLDLGAAGTHPPEEPEIMGLVVSDDAFNQGESGLVIVVPISNIWTANPLHIPLNSGEGGVQGRRVIKCDNIHTISMQRLKTCVGVVADATLAAVEDRLGYIFGR